MITGIYSYDITIGFVIGILPIMFMMIFFK